MHAGGKVCERMRRDGAPCNRYFRWLFDGKDWVQTEPDTCLPTDGEFDVTRHDRHDCNFDVGLRLGRMLETIEELKREVERLTAENQKLKSGHALTRPKKQKPPPTRAPWAAADYAALKTACKEFSTKHGGNAERFLAHMNQTTKTARRMSAYVAKLRAAYSIDPEIANYSTVFEILNEYYKKHDFYCKKPKQNKTNGAQHAATQTGIQPRTNA